MIALHSIWCLLHATRFTGGRVGCKVQDYPLATSASANPDIRFIFSHTVRLRRATIQTKIQTFFDQLKHCKPNNHVVGRGEK
jgi:hypothetical protein